MNVTLYCSCTENKCISHVCLSHYINTQELLDRYSCTYMELLYRLGHCKWMLYQLVHIHITFLTWEHCVFHAHTFTTSLLHPIRHVYTFIAIIVLMTLWRAAADIWFIVRDSAWLNCKNRWTWRAILWCLWFCWFIHIWWCISLALPLSPT